MKFLRTLLVLLGIGIVGAGVLSIVKGVSEGSEGKVNMETMEVVAETPEMEPEMVEVEEVVMEEEKVEEMPTPAPVWEPMSFNKIKDLKGRQVKLEGPYSVEKYGVKARKGVIVNGDLYFVVKKQKYVIHAGQLIKL